jgi:hypothetical protein
MGWHIACIIRARVGIGLISFAFSTLAFLTSLCSLISSVCCGLQLGLNHFVLNFWFKALK